MSLEAEFPWVCLRVLESQTSSDQVLNHRRGGAVLELLQPQGTSCWRHPVGAANGCATSLPKDSCESTEASLSPVGEETPWDCCKGWQILSPGKQQQHPQPCPGKAWPHRFPAWRSRVGPALQWGSASSSHAEGRKAQPCSILLMDISGTALLHRLWGWAGELTRKSGKTDSSWCHTRHCRWLLWSQ